MITLRIEQGEGGYFGSYHIYANGHEMDGHNVSPLASEAAVRADFGALLQKLGITEDVTIIRAATATPETVPAAELGAE